MARKFLKGLSMTLVLFLVAGSLGACKGKTNKDPESTAGKTTSTAKSTATSSAKASAGKTTAKAGTGTNKTGSSTNDTSSAVSEGQVSGDNREQYAGGSGDMPEPNAGAGGQSGETAPAEVVIDYGGKKLVVASRNNPPIEGNSAMGDLQYRIWKDAEKKFNFQMEWKQVSGGTGEFANAFISEIMAGIHFADAMALSTKTAFPMMPEENLIMPVDDYMDFTDPLFNTDYTRTSALWRGKHYGYAGLGEPSGYGIYYNRDIFAQAGIEDLHSIVNSGRWNWDTFVEVAQAATKDFNSDSVIDQWGVSVHHPGHAANALMASNDSAVLQDVNGRVTFTLNDQKAFVALQFLSDLYNTYKVATSGNKYVMFQQGISAMQLGSQYWEGKNFKSVNFDYGFVFLPMGPHATEFAMPKTDTNFWGYPTTLQNPKEVITIMNYVQTTWDPSKPEYVTREELLRSACEGAMNNPADIEFGINVFSNPKINVLPFSFPDVTKLAEKEVYNKIIGMETTPQTAVQSIEAQAQEMVNSLLKQ